MIMVRIFLTGYESESYVATHAHTLVDTYIRKKKQPQTPPKNLLKVCPTLYLFSMKKIS
jgi:hypothetical protein